VLPFEIEKDHKQKIAPNPNSRRLKFTSTPRALVEVFDNNQLVCVFPIHARLDLRCRRRSGLENSRRGDLAVFRYDEGISTTAFATENYFNLPAGAEQSRRRRLDGTRQAGNRNARH